MPTVELPITTYRVSSNKPNQRWGSPGRLPIAANAHRALVRTTLAKLPDDAVILNATLRLFCSRNDANGGNIRIRPITGAWSSRTTWNKQPTAGGILAAANPTSMQRGEAIDFDITAWAVNGNQQGLQIDSGTAAPTGMFFFGSSAEDNKPYVLVEYTLYPDAPTGLIPDGGVVSEQSPVLSYDAEEDMTAQRVEMSLDGGDTIAWDSGWLPATEPRLDLSTIAGEPLVAQGVTVHWRVRTEGPNGQTAPSEWAEFEWDLLPTVTIVSPPSTTTDGSPVLQWEVTGGNQTAWKAELRSGSKVIDTIGWRSEPATRDWTPSKGVRVPGGVGQFTLWVRDDVTPRVAAEGAPVNVRTVMTYTTTLEGAAVAVDTLTYAYDEPVVTLTGTRASGVPDEVLLVRDGVVVPLWGEDGTVYPGWAPGAEFFDGTSFALPDYTADPHYEHTWRVRTRALPDTVSAAGPSVTFKPTTNSVWLVDPRTGQKVEVFGHNGLPVVEQTTDEASILHTPLNGGLVVEPVRRRIIRTTRSGTITGEVLGNDEATFDEWVENDSGLRYRLIFGKVNWSVILGDYSPADLIHLRDCEPNSVLVSANWWQRLRDY